MSERATSWVLHHSLARHATRHLLLTLAIAADDAAWVIAPRSTVGEWTGLSRRSLQRHVSTAEDLGELLVSGCGDGTLWVLPLVPGAEWPDIPPRRDPLGLVRTLGRGTREATS